MPRPTDNANRPSSQPPPELNPLINPVLGQNMGRWAEVYFNNPPEHREEAVLELLHELEAEVFHHQLSLREDRAPQTSATMLSVPDTLPSQIAEGQKAIACESCGRENPPRHRFCGMCGVPLPDAATESGLVEPMPPDGAWPVPDPAPAFSATEIIHVGALTSSEPNLIDFERQFHSREDHVVRIPALSSSQNSYRAYVGAALALLIVTLLFFTWRSSAWRGGASTSSSTSEMAPVAVSSNPPSASAPSASAPKTAAELRKTPAIELAASKSHTARPIEKAGSRFIPVKRVPVKPTNASPIAKASPPGPQSQSVPTSGSAELAVAQGYLNGTDGQTRNTNEAVQWLWKAVAKRNAAATLQLSDLYLKGDGVPKNCDQARVLLDAAAQKGMKEASDRLRHLQSFGCE